MRPSEATDWFRFVDVDDSLGHHRVVHGSRTALPKKTVFSATMTARMRRHPHAVRGRGAVVDALEALHREERNGPRDECRDHEPVRVPFRSDDGSTIMGGPARGNVGLGIRILDTTRLFKPTSA